MPGIEVKGSHIRERQRSPTEFVPGSFRTIVEHGHDIVIGHLKNDGIAVQTILHPLSEKKKFHLK